MIETMNLAGKILSVVLLFMLPDTSGQDSTNSKLGYISYSVPSRSHFSGEIAYLFKYHSVYQFKESKFDITALPTYLNSERVMNDGTSWTEYSDINYFRLSYMIGLMAATNTVAYIYQRKVWYTEETTVFHSLEFINDWNKYQQMDKFGHFSDAYFTSDLTGKIYRWSGMSGNTSVWLGAITGWAWMLEIELSDAFMSEWGFSWGDMLANTAGSAFYILQQFNYEALGGIHPKFSWHKSEAWKENRYNKDPQALIEDYEGMTFWLTVNPHHYFPDSWKKNYSEWLAPLGLAFGVSAKDIGIYPWGGYKEYFVGLDIDLRKLPIWDDWGFFKFVKSELNFLRLPLPTIRFSPHGTWFGFYF
ncbi:MAG TPA: DUF2279 domain-containing protein [Ignavibacteriaceae bacterium]